MVSFGFLIRGISLSIVCCLCFSGCTSRNAAEIVASSAAGVAGGNPVGAAYELGLLGSAILIEKGIDVVSDVIKDNETDEVQNHECQLTAESYLDVLEKALRQKMMDSTSAKFERNENVLDVFLENNSLFSQLSSELQGDGAEQIVPLIDVLSLIDDNQLMIYGSLDETEFPEFYRSLPSRRAKNLMDVMVDKGLSGDRITFSQNERNSGSNNDGLASHKAHIQISISPNQNICTASN